MQKDVPKERKKEKRHESNERKKKEFEMKKPPSDPIPLFEQWTTKTRKKNQEKTKKKQKKTISFRKQLRGGREKIFQTFEF